MHKNIVSFKRTDTIPIMDINILKQRPKNFLNMADCYPMAGRLITSGQQTNWSSNQDMHTTHTT